MGGTNAQYGQMPQINPAQGANFQFNPLQPIQVNSANPQAIAQGIGQGIQNASDLYRQALISKNSQRNQSPQAQQQMSLQATPDQIAMDKMAVGYGTPVQPGLPGTQSFNDWMDKNGWN
jgi:hypothetical protein